MRHFMILVIFIPLLHSPSVGLFLNCIILLALLAAPLISKSGPFTGVTEDTGPGRSYSRLACVTSRTSPNKAALPGRHRRRDGGGESLSSESTAPMTYL